jgi:hypothetical protein
MEVGGRETNTQQATARPAPHDPFGFDAQSGGDDEILL